MRKMLMSTKYLALAIAVMTSVAKDASACECSQYVLDPSDVIAKVAKTAIEGDRSTRIVSTEDIRAYPSLAERLNLDSFKGTACEVKGPNNESLFECSSRSKVDTKVIATKAISSTQDVTCTVIVRSIATFRSVSAKVISKHCE